MIRYYFFLILICSCSPSHTDTDSKEDNSPISKTKVFHSEHGGFGYDIEMDGKLVVHQPNVPVINGYRGFATQYDAQTVADLVVIKIRNNQVPPALTADELAHYTKQSF